MARVAFHARGSDCVRQGVMKNNIEKTLQRGDKLNELDSKAEKLNAHASTFQKSSKKVNRKFCLQNAKWTILLVLIILIILALLIWYFVKD